MRKYKLQVRFITKQKSHRIFSRSEKQIIIDTINETIDFPYPDLHSLEQLDKLHTQLIKNQNIIDKLKRTLSYSEYMTESGKYYDRVENLEEEINKVFLPGIENESCLQDFCISFPKSNTKIQLKANAKALYLFFRRVGIRVLYPCQLCKQQRVLSNTKYQICRDCEKVLIVAVCKSFNCPCCEEPRIEYCGYEGYAQEAFNHLIEGGFF